MRIFNRLMVVVFVLVLASCNKDGGEVEPSTTDNLSPQASAGLDQTIRTNSIVNLNGTASSDPDGNPLTYSWTLTLQPTDSTATLTNANTATPSFTPDVDGDYIITLIVNDGQVNSTADTVSISASIDVVNSVPVAKAGADQAVATSTSVNLDGSASSDADGNPLTYTWTLTLQPAGSTATLTNANTASTSFTPDVDGDYIITLVVNDGQDDSTADTVIISALTNAVNSVPVANAGTGQTVTTGMTVNLDGSASNDADGNPLTYSWTLSSQPAGSTATLINANTDKPSFVPDVDGSYTITLVVNDGEDDSNNLATVVVISSTVAIDPGNVMAYAQAMVVGGWTTTLYTGNTSDTNIFAHFFICPSGGMLGWENQITPGSDRDWLATGTWGLETTSVGDERDDYATIRLDYITEINVFGVFESGDGFLAQGNGLMYFNSDDDGITYYWDNNWYAMERVIDDGDTTDVDDSYCGTSSPGGTDQCGTDADCGRCWYCDTDGSSNTCRYGGEGPFGCYRGWEPP